MYRHLLALVAASAVVLAGCSSSSTSTQPTAVAPTAAAKPATVASPSAAPAASISPAPSPAAAAAVASPSASPATATALPRPTTPSPTPGTPSTATPVAAVQTVWVANTEGGGVFLRNSPHDGDRTTTVLAENTQLNVTGELTEGDGQNWYPVTTQDNATGYVPETYTTKTDPKAAPLPIVQDATR